MALPSGGGQGGDQDFIAIVAVKVDPATLDAAGAQIRDALKKATSDVNLAGLAKLVELAAKFTGETTKGAVEAEKLKQQILKTAEAEEKLSAAKLRTQTVSASLEQTQARANRAAEETVKAQSSYQEKNDAAIRKYTASLQFLVSEQAKLTAELNRTATAADTAYNLIAKGPGVINPNFNLGNLAGGLGNNFFSTLLSGGGLNSALSQSLGQLQPALFQVAQGGEAASAAFAKLGIEGVGAVSGLTSGMAGLGVAALAVVPVIGAIKDGIVGAYEQQKEFVFQSGILAKQLGTTAEEGAKLRALLTLVGQEDNIFAAITLNQIQASVAALDRVNRGLETASPQVEKFGQALAQLGVSYQNNNGSLKTFAELTVDISAGLQKLDTAQRSLAIQNLAGLFGSDVAKIFGFGPEGLTTVLQSAVVVTNEQAKANDNLQVSLATLTAAQTEFNITLAAGLTPLETFINTVKAGALGESTGILNDVFARLSGGRIDTAQIEKRGTDIGGALARSISIGFQAYPVAILFNSIFPDEAELKRRAENLRASIALGGAPQDLALYAQNLAIIEERLRVIASVRFQGVDKSRDITAVEELGPSTAALKLRYGELEKALDATEKAAKELLDVQKDIAKNNLDIAKSFDSQINAIQKTAENYDSYYAKVADTLGKINAIQSKEGRPFSFIGSGSVKDVEKAIVDLRVLEERLTKLDEKLDPGAPRFDQLALNISRRRAALGLQPGELTDIANVDITVGITGLSKKDRAELNELFQELSAFKKEFVQGGFDVAQATFKNFIQGLSGTLSGSEFNKLLTSGAGALQEYAESVGLFSSPGFSQAIGEAALQAQLLAGGFGDLNSAASASTAFDKYTEALQGFREDLFGLSDFISGGKVIDIPIAISFGLVTQGQVDLAAVDPATIKSQAERLVQTGEITVEQYRQQIQEAAAARADVGALGTGKGIVDLLLAKYGVKTGEAIEATAKFAIDGEFDTSLAKRKADAEAAKLKAAENQRNIILKWNFQIEPTINTAEIRAWLQSQLAALTPGGTTTPPPVYGPPPAPPPPSYTNPFPPATPFAAGGDVMRGIPALVGEEGKPELFIPPTNGRIIPGNDTATLMRMFAGRERLPAPQTINYSPVVQQTLNVDARGTNARDVTQAVQRTQRKGSLFTSSSDLVRNRDFLRSRGLT